MLDRHDEYDVTEVLDTVINVRVAGVTFEGRQDLIREMEEGEEIYLKPEPDNLYDPNAIAVYNSKDQHVGYIPRAKTAFFSGNERGYASRVDILDPPKSCGLTITLH